MSWYESTGEDWDRLARKLTRLVDLIIGRLESSETSATILHLTIKGTEMANYQLNAGDSVVVTVTDTDAVTGAVVKPDAFPSVVLSSATDSVVANTDGTYTITAGTTLGTGNTLTVNATVGGVASTPAVGTYDVVPAVVGADATTLVVTFGTETAPFPAPAVAPAPPLNAGNRPVTGGGVAGQVDLATGLVNP